MVDKTNFLKTTFELPVHSPYVGNHYFSFTQWYLTTTPIAHRGGRATHINPGIDSTEETGKLEPPAKRQRVDCIEEVN